MADNWAETFNEVEYNENVTHTLRQEPGILYPLAGTTKSYTGVTEAKIEDRFGRLQMHRKTTRNGDTNWQDPNVSRRFIKKPGKKNLGVMIDRDDMHGTSVELESPLVNESASAGRTYHDDMFLLGWWGDAWIGTETSESTIPFPAANKVPHNLGGASVGFTKAKLIELRRQLQKANVNFQREKPIILLDADAESELFSIPEYINFDFNGSKPLVDGEVKPWMGFRFMSANLGDQAAYPEAYSLFQVGGINRLPVIIPSGLHRGVWVEFFGKIEREMIEKQASTGIYAEAESTVTRTDEAKAWFIETKPIA